METLTEQARGLSSGTLANLTGYTWYGAIEAVQADFVTFCENQGEDGEKWPSAWCRFWDGDDETYRMWRAYDAQRCGIISVLAANREGARRRVRHQLDREGRRAFLETWGNGGEIVEIKKE